MPEQDLLPVYQAGECEIDLARREFRARGVPVPLGGRAFEIIEVLVRSAGDLVTKNDLMDRVWPGAIIGDNTLQVHISAVRKALGPYRAMLKTESGRGYRLLEGWTVRHRAANAPLIAPLADRSADPESTPDHRESAATNFPVNVTGLIGRSAAARRLRDLVSAWRVVTLTGPGGIGKTTLAIEVGRALLDDFRDGAWFVDLAALSAPDLVPSAVINAMGLKPIGDAVSAEAVARAIGGQNLLLVLDNCEHVIDAVANLTELLVRQCPRTTVMATSREILRIDGEFVYRVPPLDVPVADAVDPDHILNHSAIELFVARTTALDSLFSPGDAELASIAAICRRLDGIPLAIEFAAARGATLGIQQVASGLNDRFALLIGGRRTALPRHRTLRATLDWSYALLPEAERLLLRHLSLFASGFTLEAAIAVAPGTNFAAYGMVECLANLVARSLVAFDQSATPERWRLLETIRAYALEKLVEHDESDAARRRFAMHFRDLFAPGSGSIWRFSDEELTLRIREIDNVRAALDWCFSTTGDPVIGVDLTAAYGPVWLHLSLMTECRERCERAVLSAQPDGAPNTRQLMRLHAALGSALLSTMAPAEQSITVLNQALQVAETLGDLDVQARVLLTLAAVLVFRGEYGEARGVVERLSQVAWQIGDPSIIATADRRMGQMLLTTGQLAESQQCLERVLRHPIRPADQRAMVLFEIDDRAMARAMLARALCLRGFMDRAFAEARTSVDELHGTARQISVCRVLYFGLCRITLMTRDLAGAASAITHFNQVAGSVNAPFWKTVGRFLEGKLLVERGEFATGAAVLREAFDTCRHTGWRASYPEFMGSLAEALGGLGRLGEALDAVSDAVTSAGQGADGQVWYVPELLRIRGELLLRQATHRSAAAAEACFRQASEMASEQGALFWELRIALSRARSHMTRGQHARARDILAPVHGRFTEGFAVADLRDARDLLDALS